MKKYLTKLIPISTIVIVCCLFTSIYAGDEPAVECTDIQTKTDCEKSEPSLDPCSGGDGDDSGRGGADEWTSNMVDTYGCDKDPGRTINVKDPVCLSAGEKCPQVNPPSKTWEGCPDDPNAKKADCDCTEPVQLCLKGCSLPGTEGDDGTECASYDQYNNCCSILPNNTEGTAPSENVELCSTFTSPISIIFSGTLQKKKTIIDIDGDGISEVVSFYNSYNAPLLVDISKVDTSNKINGKALFGNNYDGKILKDGFVALKSLDNNNDNIIDANEAKNIVFWNDSNLNSVIDQGESTTLTDRGLKQIFLTGERSVQQSDDDIFMTLTNSNQPTLVDWWVDVKRDSFAKN